MTDFFHTLRWIVTLELLQLIFLPLTFQWAKKLFFQGIFLSKFLSLLAVSFFVWVVGSLHLLPFSTLSLWLGVIFFASINIFQFKKTSNFLIEKKFWKKFLIAELCFLAPFIVWTVCRGFNPNIDNFEKFMDFNFVNAILKTQYFPPQDTWFAGQPINYYYFGHLFSAVLIKLTGVPATVGYNLMMSTIVAVSCGITFTIGASLGQQFKLDRKHVIISGVLTTLFVLFAGTLYTFSFIFEKNLESFWFWRSIRLIPGAIHEFPQYSFAVSDLHAHMINIPVVLLIIASIILLWTKVKQEGLTTTILPYLLVHGWLLGICFMTSAWDLPIYLGLTGVVLFFTEVLKTNAFWQSIWKSIVYFLVIVIAIGCTVFFFWRQFDFSISEGVGFVHSHTFIHHYLTLWTPAILTVLFALFFWKKSWKNDKKNIFQYVFILLLSLWGFMLTAVPEVIYLKDIYGGDFYRGNTILKFYYQAFIILGIVSALFLTKMVSSRTSKLIRFSLIIPASLWIACLLYPFQIIPSYYEDFKKWYGLDGSYFMQLYYPDEFEAIQWLKKNVQGQAVVLEAAGDSYSYDNRVSTFTGLPTVQGWFVHEWLWRGGADKPGERANAVRDFYEGEDLNNKQQLMKKYQVSYVFVGEVERKKYPLLNLQAIESLGSIVYQNNQTIIIKISAD